MVTATTTPIIDDVNVANKNIFEIFIKFSTPIIIRWINKFRPIKIEQITIENKFVLKKYSISEKPA